MAMIKSIDHISINVVNIRETLDFYTRILGLEQLQTVDFGDFEITYLSLPNGSRLELFDYRATNQSHPRQESEVGLRHIAFEVEGVAAHEKHLRDLGVEITLQTCELPELGVRVLLFLDPNGVTLEFCEKL